jgi:hypothetical protein
MKSPQGVELILEITVSPMRLEDADLKCLEHPDGTLELVDGRGATADYVALRGGICGTSYGDVSNKHLQVTIREQ